MNSQERMEKLLTTVDLLGVTTIRQLMRIHDLKSYRNAARYVSDKLSPYLNSTYYERQKVFYLNKEGRKLIASSKEIKNSPQIVHTLLRNEVYIFLQRPHDWKVECMLESKQSTPQYKAIEVKGLKESNSTKIVADALFTRNGYVYFIEIDNTRSMVDNQRKIEKYKQILPSIRNKYSNLSPKLLIFTTTESRKKNFIKICSQANVPHEVKTFEDIK